MKGTKTKPPVSQENLPGRKHPQENLLGRKHPQ